MAIEDVFAVKFKKPPLAYRTGKEGLWFSFQAADRTGEMTARFWGRDERETNAVYSSFGKGDVVIVKGAVKEFNGTLQISVEPESGGSVKKASTYETGDFVPSSERSIEEMVLELRQIASRVNDAHIRALMDEFLKDDAFMERFSRAPAAMHRHQNYIGGLIEHVLNMMKICSRLAEVHPSLDRDLLLAGCFFHDIGKVKEFEVTTSIDVSTEGMLVGHINIGQNMVLERIARIGGFPEVLKLKIIHMILSHQGKLEYGSPKVPQFPEAIAIYYADECDAKLDYAIRLKRGANTEDLWIWTKDFGHVFLE